MSTSYDAELSACCLLDYSQVIDAIDLLDEPLQDIAWDAVNDAGIRPGPLDDPYPDEEFYVGLPVITSGDEDGFDDKELLAHAQDLATMRSQTLAAIEAHMGDSDEPEFTAFMDWFFKQVAEAKNWKYRILMTWG